MPLSSVKLSTDSFRGPLIDTVALSPSPAECVDCGRVCSGDDDEAAKAATTQSMRKCKQFMRPSTQVLGFLPHLTGIPKERERKKQRENDDSALVIM